MSITAALLPEFDHEMANTRRTLERVPDDKFGWKPHDRSTTIGGLATHTANLPTWAVLALGGDEFDRAPGGRPIRATLLSSTKEVLAAFDANVAAARAA